MCQGWKGVLRFPPFPLNNPPFPRKRSTRLGLPFWPTKIFAALGSNFLNQRVQQREMIRVDLTQNGCARRRSAKADMRAPIGIYRMKKREEILSLLLIYANLPGAVGKSFGLDKPSPQGQPEGVHRYAERRGLFETQGNKKRRNSKNRISSSVFLLSSTKRPLIAFVKKNRFPYIALFCFACSRRFYNARDGFATH